MTIAHSFLLGRQDVHADKTKLLLPFNGDMLDVYNHTFASVGSPALVSNDNPFGTGDCVNFPGSSNRQCSHSDFATGTGEYTWEGWIKPLAGSDPYGRILETESYPSEGGISIVLIPGNPAYMMLQQGYRVYNTIGVLSVTTVPNGVWTYFRAGLGASALRLQLGDAAPAVSGFSDICSATKYNLAIGSNWNGGESLVGKLSNLRFTPGVWRGNEPMPTEPLPIP
jgi:hypothetical protein